MKALKYLLQIIASAIYSYVFVAILWIILVLPIAYVLSLPLWGILLVCIFAMPIVYGLQNLITTFGLMPFSWITKKNIVSTTFACIIIVAMSGYFIVNLWRENWGAGWIVYLFVGYISCLILYMVFASVMLICGMYQESKTSD